jgi:PAS domain S-box-containing protein
MAHAIGIITVTPIILVVAWPWAAKVFRAQRRRRTFGRRGVLEAVAWLLVTAGLLVLVFGSPIARQFHLFYLLLLPLIWAALRAGLPGGASSTFLLNHGVIVMLWLKGLYFNNVIDLQLFILVLSLTGLLLGTAISERNQSQQTRRQAEEWYRLVFRNMNESMAVSRLVSDADGHPVDWQFVDVNPTFSTITGLAHEAVVGKLASELLPEDYCNRFLALFARVVQRGEPIRCEYASEIISKDFLLSAYPLEDMLFVTIHADITGLKQAERARNRFLEVLSHELRTPLTNILGWADLACESPTQSQVAIEVIERNAKQLRSMLQDLIDIARLFYGQFQLQKSPTDLWQLALHQADSWRDELQRSHITLLVCAPSEPLPVEADAARIEQIIDHLLENACKFTSPGGAITLTGARTATAGSISIIDTGRGLSPEQIASLFTPFLQIERSEQIGGLGIGLVLAKNLVELHGGQLIVTSPGIGKGSTFIISLPLVDPLIGQ